MSSTNGNGKTSNKTVNLRIHTDDNQKPPPAEHEVDITDRDHHDIFNLIALPIMLGSLLPNWDMGVFFLKGGTLEESWSNDFLYECMFVINLYFVLDLAWVALVPTCVKSPGTIIKVNKEGKWTSKNIFISVLARH
jgi:hypothetical protein